MIKILAIIGSPRRNGNTHILIDKLLEGAKSEGADTDSIFLNDFKITECDGCHVCWKGMECPKRDDMNGFYEKIIYSDVLIFGTPVYWYGPTALMKGFIDRLVYFNCPENREKIKGKAVAVVIPFEEEDERASLATVEIFEKSLGYLEMNLTDVLLAPGVGEKGAILEKKIILERAFNIGRMLTR
ncbi:MAG TPA: flavodoxin family protein [Methanofastidiosum sp.]|nr:flavodoxin family protein [Methanofastidiosum sp.]HPA49690.1 flavodoxin family protein [Methanofastidiosum sp.]HQK62608.1 flavodoxin family protein [Methanofastidiosum sp.]HQQ49380.1 flavodoxin family protein [Methanofastidiosum sp.]